MGSEHISNDRYGKFSILMISIIFLLELPNDFAAMQEEIERQKAALLEKTKPKETIEVSGKE